LLQGWLKEDTALLTVLDGIQRAARDWAANGKAASYLAHTKERLRAAERLQARPDLAANLEPTDKDYVAACRWAEQAAQTRTRRVQALVGVLVAAMVASLAAWRYQVQLSQDIYWFTEVRGQVLTPEQQRALKPGNPPFKECTDCPELIVVPAGNFTMGGDPSLFGTRDEGPPHGVTIAKPFAVARFELTFDEWDACAAHGDCDPLISASGYGRGRQPVINVSWDDAQRYVAWLSKMTGQPYRLLTEAEWEYAARAGTTTEYYWGDELGKGNANCAGGCGSQWDGKQTAPVGSFAANAFGLYDMAGNVFQWVQDCYHNTYNEAPTDGSAWTVETAAGSGECSYRVLRGGCWGYPRMALRSSSRSRTSPGNRNQCFGFRVGRTLTP
jgi:formylglycine-generating enzyme required for sulfatase activity